MSLSHGLYRGSLFLAWETSTQTVILNPQFRRDSISLLFRILQPIFMWLQSYAINSRLRRAGFVRIRPQKSPTVCPNAEVV
jgi:hypothetical protein